MWVSLILALFGGEWSASRSGRFITGEIVTGTRRKGGWVGPTVGRVEVQNVTLLGVEPEQASLEPVAIPTDNSSRNANNLFHISFLLGLINPEDATSSETSIEFTGLHGVISKKAEVFNMKHDL
jgi:hypothetical protein